ncbi:uncharacterized protein B0T15DRAFT_135611 [Chaetomium strumarium]|uniref:Uncharacterized protein n=1 Tax=Chaetomium strumarium TaxID=1170767 RepID=A0AAJ0GZZ1_9PEZI|nr:hypothetical protein B0T15DRAFT_135611 [Chaetomium strumarium]
MPQLIDAAELRRRWTDKTNAVFSPRDRHESTEYPAVDFEREFDFEDCQSIVFLHGERTGSPTDVILMTQGSGHMTLPANVQVLVQSGYSKCEPARGSLSSGGSTVVGAGIRAPPSSRVGVSTAAAPVSQAGYARSSADSGYSGSGFARGGNDAASFMMRGSSGLAFNGSRPSSAESSAGDWEIVEEMPGAAGAGSRFRDDACSIAPSESISSVGSRGRYARDY